MSNENGKKGSLSVAVLKLFGSLVVVFTLVFVPSNPTIAMPEKSIEKRQNNKRRTIEVREYTGDFNELENDGYVNTGAMIITDREGQLVADNMIFIHQVLSNGHVEKYVYSYITIMGRDSKGHAIHRLEHALEYELSDKSRVLDSDDVGCISSAFPKLVVVAIGKWKWREDPRQGGYAHSIKYAWVADPAIKKFREISPNSVVCEINEDRD